MSEYSLLEDNGFHEKYVNRDYKKMYGLEKKTFFDIYQRPTINYKLECES